MAGGRPTEKQSSKMKKNPDIRLYDNGKNPMVIMSTPLLFFDQGCKIFAIYKWPAPGLFFPYSLFFF